MVGAKNLFDFFLIQFRNALPEWVMSAVDIGGFLRHAPLSFSQQSSVSYTRNGVNGFYTLDAIEDQPEKTVHSQRKCLIFLW